MFNKIMNTFEKFKTGGKGTVIIVILAIAIMVTPPLIWTITQVSGQFSGPDTITMDGPASETQEQVAIIDGEICNTGYSECTGGKCTW